MRKVNLLIYNALNSSIIYNVKHFNKVMYIMKQLGLFSLVIVAILTAFATISNAVTPCNTTITTTIPGNTTTIPGSTTTILGSNTTILGSNTTILGSNTTIPGNTPITTTIPGTVNPAVPNIKANGFDGPVTISQGDNLTVTVSLEPGIHSGMNADLWVAAESPFGLYWFTLDMGWVRSDTSIRVYGGPLFILSPYTVLEMSTLPVGEYTFYFGIDTNKNGSLDLDLLYYDSVSVNINILISTYIAEITDPDNPYSVVAVDGVNGKETETLGITASKDTSGNITGITGVSYGSFLDGSWAHLTIGTDELFSTYDDSDGYKALFSNYTANSVDIKLYDSIGILVAGPTTVSIDTSALNALQQLSSNSWDFNGGAPNSSLEDPGNVTFNTAGTYNITFKVTDSNGEWDSDTVSITIVSPSCENVAGTWNVTEFWNVGNSCDMSGGAETYPVTVTQNGCNLTINDEGDIYFSTIVGDTFSYTWEASEFNPDDGGTIGVVEPTTITVSGNSFTGSSTWDITFNGELSCSGESTYTGTRQ